MSMEATTDEFRDCCFQNDIIGNIDQNQRNGSDKEYLLYNFILVNNFFKVFIPVFFWCTIVFFMEYFKETTPV